MISRYTSVAGIGVYWQLFGSNGHIEKPAGLVTENFTRRAPTDFWCNRHTKAIVRPSAVTNVLSSHMFALAGDYVDECGRPLIAGPSPGYFEHYIASSDRFCLNHYFLKSRRHYEIKRRRLYFGGDDKGISEDTRRAEEIWEAHDQNEIEDRSAQAYTCLMRDYLQRS